MARPLFEGQILFPSNYICAEDLKGRDVTVTIESVGIDDLPIQGSAKKKRSFLIGFKGKTKKLVCNKTNAVSIADIHGQEAKAWIGKQITIYPTTTKFKGKPTPCIRVRDTSAPAEPEQPPQSDEFASDDPLAGTTPNTEAA